LARHALTGGNACCAAPGKTVPRPVPRPDLRFCTITS
jgi:hypothetical protein